MLDRYLGLPAKFPTFDFLMLFRVMRLKLEGLLRADYDGYRPQTRIIQLDVLYSQIHFLLSSLESL